MLFQAFIRSEVLVLLVYTVMMLQAAIYTGTLLHAVAEWRGNLYIMLLQAVAEWSSYLFHHDVAGHGGMEQLSTLCEVAVVTEWSAVDIYTVMLLQAVAEWSRHLYCDAVAGCGGMK